MSDLKEKINDAISVAPHLHTTIFENNKLRVIKVKVKPGERAEMHWHPENVNYILSSGKLRFTRADGTLTEVELKEGQVTHSGPGSHIVENTGDTEVQTVQVEIKVTT